MCTPTLATIRMNVSMMNVTVCKNVSIHRRHTINKQSSGIIIYHLVASPTPNIQTASFPSGMTHAIICPTPVHKLMSRSAGLNMCVSALYGGR